MNIYLISLQSHTLWVLISSETPYPGAWVPTCFFMEKLEKKKYMYFFVEKMPNLELLLE